MSCLVRLETMRTAEKFFGLALTLQLGLLTAATASAQAPAAPTAEAVAPASQAAPEPKANAAAANADSASGPLVEPGPAEDKRLALLGRIINAKDKGIGIDAYLSAFSALEQSVKGGESEAVILKRLESLNSSLDDQIKRSVILKTQRPAPPVAASSPPPSAMGRFSGGSGGGSDMLQQLKEKYGGQIPDNLKDKLGGQLPDSIKDKLPAGLGNMSPDQLKELVKQFKK